MKCYKAFSALDKFDFSKNQAILIWSHFSASVATRNPLFPYRTAPFWEQTMKELKEKTKVRLPSHCLLTCSLVLCLLRSSCASHPSPAAFLAYGRLPLL